jgi:hypothetical protein
MDGGYRSRAEFYRKDQPLTAGDAEDADDEQQQQSNRQGAKRINNKILYRQERQERQGRQEKQEYN